MPKIREYTSTGEITPDSKGYAAREMAARRIGPLYNQAGADYQKMAALENQATDAQKLLFDPNAAPAPHASSGGGGSGGGSGGGGGGGSAKPQKSSPRAPTEAPWQDAASLSAIAVDKVVGNRGSFITYPGADTQSGRGMYTPDGLPGTVRSGGSDTGGSSEGSTNTWEGQDYWGSTTARADQGGSARDAGRTEQNYDPTSDTTAASPDTAEYWRRYQGGFGAPIPGSYGDIGPPAPTPSFWGGALGIVNALANQGTSAVASEAASPVPELQPGF